MLAIAAGTVSGARDVVSFHGLRPRQPCAWNTPLRLGKLVGERTAILMPYVLQPLFGGRLPYLRIRPSRIRAISSVGRHPSSHGPKSVGEAR
jgi:hypothetical protein